MKARVMKEWTTQTVAVAFQRVGAGQERHAGKVLGLLLCILFLVCLSKAGTVFLWYDEIVILGTASFAHASDIWRFYASGRDVEGPLASFIVHAAIWLPFSPEISARLPFILSFLGMLSCGFVFVRRRYPASFAFAVLLLLASPPLFELATQVKSYALELTAIACAMVCWQSAIRGQGRPWSVLGLWSTLALAVNAHKFAIFVFVPFAAAQWFRDYRERKIDPPIWMALILFPAGLLPVIRGELVASRFYAGSFWSRPELHFLYGSYKTYFLWQWLLITCVVSFITMSAFLAGRERSPTVVEPKTSGFSAPEWVFLTVLAALPLYALPTSYVVQAYREVYVCSFAIGIAILIVTIAAEQAKRTKASGAVLFVLFALITLPRHLESLRQGVRVITHPDSVHNQLQSKFNNQAWVKLIEASSLPVLAGDHSLYTPLSYYASPSLKRRSYYLTDFAEANQYPRSMTAQINFLLFGQLLSFQTMDISGFLPSNPHFLLIAGTDPAMWLPTYLMRKEQEGGATLELLGPDFNPPNIYDVHVKRMPVFPPPRWRDDAVSTH